VSNACGAGDQLRCRVAQRTIGGARTFFVCGSSTVPTSLLSSLRIDLAATPVVAVLKSMWLLPRTRALNESLRGINDADILAGLPQVISNEKRAMGPIAAGSGGRWNGTLTGGGGCGLAWWWWWR
jgi:hypothetical protein